MENTIGWWCVVCGQRVADDQKQSKDVIERHPDDPRQNKGAATKGYPGPCPSGGDSRLTWVSITVDIDLITGAKVARWPDDQSTVYPCEIELRLPGMRVIGSHCWHWSWARRAAEQFDIARRARRAVVKTNDGKHIATEFDASLTCIGASAFAIEALHNAAKEVVISSDTLKAWAGDKMKSSQIARIRETLRCTAEFSTALMTEIESLFNLRNRAVHPVSRFGAMKMHPSGHSYVTEIEATYVLEAAESALKTVRESFATCIASPTSDAQKWIEAQKGGLTAPIARIDESLAAKSDDDGDLPS